MTFELVGIGEVLWDLLPGGRQMGGAPANFACHARALGARAGVISRVGDDGLGRELADRLRELGVDTDCLEVDPAAPTGTVAVEVGPGGEPHFDIREGVAWDNLRGGAVVARAAARADALCFGTLARRSEPARGAVGALLHAARPGALRVFDVNLRQHYYSRELIAEGLALSDVLKLNETELPRLAELFDLSGGPRDQMAWLAERHRLHAVAYTRGGRGSLLLAGGRWSDHPGLPVDVRDTVGAGDAFTAAMTLGLLAGWDVEEINARANAVAAHVASRAGATPDLPDHLRAPFLSLNPPARAGAPQP